MERSMDALVPKMGPDPVLISRKEVDALYETFSAIVLALDALGVDYIVTGGSLLGAVRQHSILFCDDDIDIAIIEYGETSNGETSYSRVSKQLGALLGPDFSYDIRPWEGGDKVRPKRASNVFVDIFTLRRFETMEELTDLLAVKKNGQPQTYPYVHGIVRAIETSAAKTHDEQDTVLPLCPFWHFNTRKAVEMWPKEVYRECELFPLSRDLKFGPLTGIKGPKSPVLLLKRAFGLDCFEVYYQSKSHNKQLKPLQPADSATAKQSGTNQDINTDQQQAGSHKYGTNVSDLNPLVLEGGTWEGGEKVLLLDEHLVPMQPLSRVKRRPTLHGREQLLKYLAEQTAREKAWLREEQQQLVPDRNRQDLITSARPRRTVYMDGVFDLFHVGHLEAIRQCAALGDRVVIGVTGDEDASGYKRPPIISEANRVAVVAALKEVDAVVCPCPLVVTEDFMEKHAIDLVVHGFASEADAKRQEVFFEVPVRLGKFQTIGYYQGLSTTDIINKILSISKL